MYSPFPPPERRVEPPGVFYARFSLTIALRVRSCYIADELNGDHKMVLKKCPSCKNVVSWESYCCPRCGIEFRAVRIRRAIGLLCILGLVAWIVYRYFLR